MAAMDDTALVKRLTASYRCMVQSRLIDEVEVAMTNSGEAFFHVSGAGHEAIAVLEDALRPVDWLHCHYRDKALMLARGIPVEMFLLATLNKGTSHSHGRQMNAHMTDPSLNILSIVGPVGNNALQAAGVAEQIKEHTGNPIVLCAMGDGTTQQGEVMEAIAHASRQVLPVLFLIEDNELAISTRTTQKTFFSTPDGDLDSFHGVPISHVDGSDAPHLREEFQKIVTQIRDDRKAHIVRLKLHRLSHHTNADNQNVYRDETEIERVRAQFDPIVKTRAWLKEHGVSEHELQRIEADINQEVRHAAQSARQAPDPQATYIAKSDLPVHLLPNAAEYRGTITHNTVEDAPPDVEDRLTMLEAMREVLKYHLEHNERVVLFGEDIEDPKGDVFGLTKGLSSAFPQRVINSPLAESSIVGISVGRALCGAFPVAFLQFADFLPIAYNQIFSELGSMYWRSNGTWSIPMIVMITCGAYRPGLGPFHASSLESIAAHTPGVDVMMPSSAGDAAGLLNAAFQSGRPTLFFYPKSALNDRNRLTSSDISAHVVPIGKGRLTRSGDSLTLVGWGNTVALCEKANDALQEYGINCDVIDLRSINPWDIDMVTQSVRKSESLIIVHEDNHTAGMGAEIAATIGERVEIDIDIRRVTRADTYVPCNFGNQLEVLPSYKELLEVAVSLLGGSITWNKPAEPQGNSVPIEAIGSSPSDESVTVTTWMKSVGEKVNQGDILAELEADKSSVELVSPISGTIESRMADVGDSIKVGENLLVITADNRDDIVKKQPTKEEPGTPAITNLLTETAAKRQRLKHIKTKRQAASREVVSIGIVDIDCATGSRLVNNEEIIKNIPDWSVDDVVRRTGIESRYWIDENESALSLAVDATKKLMKKTSLQFDEIDLILCSTETPQFHTPSMATLVQNEIKDKTDGFLCPAYDVNAACTGYLYILQIAYDFLQSRPDGCVLLVTAEALSTKLDRNDPATAPIFADAGTATLLVSEKHRLNIKSEVLRPVIGAHGENGDLLRVPIPDDGYIRMDGPRVFSRAVRDMISCLRRACSQALISLSDLSRIVAHQANQRILNAVGKRLKLKDGLMFSNIRRLGNTSSSTIPLCLVSLINELKRNDYVGLTAFGGGLTFGGAVIRSR